MKQKGFFWHVHHDKLLEYCYSYEERADYIKNEKQEKEIETRLRLFKPIKDVKSLPKEWHEAYKKLNEVNKRWNEVNKKWNEANKKRKEADEKCLPELEELHKKECGCSEWNREEIVFK